MRETGLDDLRALLAVARERSFTRAAAALLVEALRYRDTPRAAQGS